METSCKSIACIPSIWNEMNTNSNSCMFAYATQTFTFQIEQDEIKVIISILLTQVFCLMNFHVEKLFSTHSKYPHIHSYKRTLTVKNWQTGELANVHTTFETIQSSRPHFEPQITKVNFSCRNSILWLATVVWMWTTHVRIHTVSENSRTFSKH